MNDLQIFKNKDFEELRTIMINGEPYFVAKDLILNLGYQKGYSDVLKQQCDKDDYFICDKTHPLTGVEFDYKELGQRGGYFVNESAMYSLILGSELESAKNFKHWITSEVLPAIRKTGGYVGNEDMFINTYLPFADEQTKLLFRTTLQTVKAQNDIIQKQQEELDYKEDVIIGLVDNIELAEKRQILNRVMRRSHSDYYDRWSLLYKEFDAKYHINTKSRMERYNNKCTNKKDKAKNRLDYIDRIMNKLPELYDIAAKLFHEDVDKLVEQLYGVR